jgi:hypothetical protein
MVTLSTSLDADEEITCHALQRALVATQLQMAWHAGVLDADTAMKSLDMAVREICSIRAMERQPNDVCKPHATGSST